VRTISWIGFGIVVLAASLFAIANRGTVTLSLDHLPPADPDWTFQLPLYLLIFAAMFAGILLGGFITRRSRR
jgi:uncharacterized integral membrane protein